jgi:hypothetical protein
MKEMEQAGLLKIDREWITVLPPGSHAGARHFHGL